MTIGGSRRCEIFFFKRPSTPGDKDPGVGFHPIHKILEQDFLDGALVGSIHWGQITKLEMRLLRLIFNVIVQVVLASQKVICLSQRLPGGHHSQNQTPSNTFISVLKNK